MVFFTLLFIPPSIANAQTVTAVWDPSPSGDLVTGYQVCVGTSSLSCSVKNASVSASTTSYKFAPTGGIVHYVAIRAVNGLGAGAYSPEVRFSIPSFAQPANQSSKVGVAITPLTLSVKDPDGSRLAYTHTGLPVGLKLDSATGTISGTPSSVGTYNVTAYVNDGLVTVSRSWTWTVTSSSSDTSAPALTITSHTSGQTVSTSTVTIAGTATDSGRGGSGIKRVTVNGLATSGGTATGSGTANWSRSISLVKGSNTITVEAADGAGNVSMKQFTLYYGTTSSASVAGATLTSNLASPQKPGTTITFTASGSGGVAPLQYKFLVKVGTSSFQTVRGWNTANKFAWTPTLVGSYTIAVWVRSDGVTKDAPQASAQKAFSISKTTTSSTDTTAPALSITSHTSGQTVTTSTVTIAGKATDSNRGGSGITGVRVNGLAASGGTATGSNTASWSRSISLVKGSNTITVEATDGAGNVSMQQFTLNYGTSSTSVTSAKLTSNLASPQKPGTTITFTASGSGGVAPLQYKFLVKTGTGSYQTVRGWNTANKFAWTPTLTGSYTVAVWVRSDGVTKDAPQASAQMAFSIKR